ncbi:Uncharacterized protein DBV15_09014 [Temnothorax longispinosus]|uniref:Uncharacterized protein n=1 Tax=Temnothorax longispinosus TaxID=300112 RepID=A0A4S2KG73_9HYME|nr:Uncharacterized protein DBV15_09014 [Temnothorax longispinosus]
MVPKGYDASGIASPTPVMKIALSAEKRRVCQPFAGIQQEYRNIARSHSGLRELCTIHNTSCRARSSDLVAELGLNQS